MSKVMYRISIKSNLTFLRAFITAPPMYEYTTEEKEQVEQAMDDMLEKHENGTITRRKLYYDKWNPTRECSMLMSDVILKNT